MDPLDQLLQRLDPSERSLRSKQLDSPPAAAKIPPASLEQLLAQISQGDRKQVQTQLSHSPPSPVTASPVTASPVTASPVTAELPLLTTLKAEQAAKQEAEALAQTRQQAAEAERQRAALVAYAQDWLKTINVTTDEGLWFEEFAYGYPSRLEAAIEYLAALQAL